MQHEPHRGGIFVAKPFRKSYEPCRGGIFVSRRISLNKHAVPMGLDHDHDRYYYKYAAPMGLNRNSTQIGDIPIYIVLMPLTINQGLGKRMSMKI